MFELDENIGEEAGNFRGACMGKTADIWKRLSFAEYYTLRKPPVHDRKPLIHVWKPPLKIAEFTERNHSFIEGNHISST